MAHHRSFDEITNSTEHVEPVHPLRALIDHHFYLDGWVSSEGGMALLMMDALLFIPFMMAVMFYPVQALIGLGAALVLSFVVYEGLVLYRRHVRRTHI